MSKQYDKWVIGVNTITNLKMFEYTNNSDLLLFRLQYVRGLT